MSITELGFTPPCRDSGCVGGWVGALFVHLNMKAQGGRGFPNL